MKKALITAITGQDGSYFAEFLLSEGYEVHGIIRRASTFNTSRIDHIYVDSHNPEHDFFSIMEIFPTLSKFLNLPLFLSKRRIYGMAIERRPMPPMAWPRKCFWYRPSLLPTGWF